MFDTSLFEMLVIFVVALLVLGPERLPKVARAVGLMIGRARSMLSQAKAELDREAQLQELAALRETGREIESTIHQAAQSVDEAKTAVSEAKAAVDEATTAAGKRAP